MPPISYDKLILENIDDILVITNDSGTILHSINLPTKITHIEQLHPELLLPCQKLTFFKEFTIDVDISITPSKKTPYQATVKQVTVDDDSHTGCLYILHNISTGKATETKLLQLNEELELRIEEQTNDLKKKNIALTEVLHQLEIEKQNIASRVGVNVQNLLLPVVDKLIEKASSVDSRYLKLVKQNLAELTSSLGIKLTSVEYRLTPKEIELCTLIKGGFSIKEIAIMQNLSDRTVETHRFNIRKKLGIASTKINLATYLSQI